jgi:hypothetical protein
LNLSPAFRISPRPKNLARHNLCTTLIPPKHFQAHLGLELKFCQTPILQQKFHFNPSNMSFFSCDAVSMYTNNINTNDVIKNILFLSTLPLFVGCPANVIITALDILIGQHIFKLLGDTFWKQDPVPQWAHHQARIALLWYLGNQIHKTLPKKPSPLSPIHQQWDWTLDTSFQS